MPGDLVEDRRDRRRLHQGRRATAEKNAVDGTPARPCRGFRKLGGDGAREPLFIGLFMPHVTVEIAIGTFRQAKRPVYIDGETGVMAAAADRFAGKNGCVSQGSSPQVSETRARDAIGLARAAAGRVSLPRSSRRRCG